MILLIDVSVCIILNVGSSPPTPLKETVAEKGLENNSSSAASSDRRERDWCSNRNWTFRSISVSELSFLFILP